MSNVQGIITFISAKTKGLHLDNNDAWFNPKGEATDKIKKEMEGTKVVLHVLDGSNSFTTFDILEAPSTVPLTKEDYWQRKEDRDVAQDRAKGRGASFNSAIEILKLSEDPEDRPRDQEEVLKEVKALALEINKWVMQ